MNGSRLVFLQTLISLFVGTSHAVEISTVTIGNPGNPADTRYINSINPHQPDGFGSVPYKFRIGKTEISNAQYVEFLNAVAATDTYGLYNTSMNQLGGIVRSGVPGSYAYAVKTSFNPSYQHANKPVNYVNPGDAMRFTNWLHNGQPVGAQDTSTTEDGAYTLNGANDFALADIARNAGARWFLPNSNEWYKAAYHKNDGITGNYWDYPTGTNSVPDNNLPSNDTGNSANHRDSMGFTTGNGNAPLTDVGAYLMSDSPYGTFDQAGSVNEWTERLVAEDYSVFPLLGGSWGNFYDRLRARGWDFDSPDEENASSGFRVAMIPEPASLTICGSMLMIFLNRGNRRLNCCQRAI